MIKHFILLSIMTILVATIIDPIVSIEPKIWSVRIAILAGCFIGSFITSFF